MSDRHSERTQLFTGDVGAVLLVFSLPILRRVARLDPLLPPFPFARPQCSPALFPLDCQMFTAVGGAFMQPTFPSCIVGVNVREPSHTMKLDLQDSAVAKALQHSRLGLRTMRKLQFQFAAKVSGDAVLKESAFVFEIEDNLRKWGHGIRSHRQRDCSNKEICSNLRTAASATGAFPRPNLFS